MSEQMAYQRGWDDSKSECAAIGKENDELHHTLATLNTALAAAEQRVGEYRELMEDAIETLEITAEVGFSAKAISEKADELRAALSGKEDE